MSEQTKEPYKYTPPTEEEREAERKAEEEFHRRQKEIFDKYPKIFPKTPYNTTPVESCMYWGLETPTSWWPVIDALCATLQGAIDGTTFLSKDGDEYYMQVEAEQVKEKWGELRFYYSQVPNTNANAVDAQQRDIGNYVSGAIDMAVTVIDMLKTQYKDN